GDCQRGPQRDGRDDSEPAADARPCARRAAAGESRRDAVKAFAYVSPANEKDAVGALGPERGKVLPLAGGQDLLAQMKDYIAQPDRLVNVKNSLDATIVAAPDGRARGGGGRAGCDLSRPAPAARP